MCNHERAASSPVLPSSTPARVVDLSASATRRRCSSTGESTPCRRRCRQSRRRDSLSACAPRRGCSLGPSPIVGLPTALVPCRRRTFRRTMGRVSSSCSEPVWLHTHKAPFSGAFLAQTDGVCVRVCTRFLLLAALSGDETGNGRGDGL